MVNSHTKSHTKKPYFSFQITEVHTVDSITQLFYTNDIARVNYY